MDVDPVLLVFVCVFVVLLIAGNLLFLGYYSHHADTEFGSQVGTKCILVSLIRSCCLSFYLKVLGYLMAEI